MRPMVHHFAGGSQPEDATGPAGPRTGGSAPTRIATDLVVRRCEDVPVTPYLETPRLLLREFTTDDADLVVELDRDPDVMHFVTGGEPTSRHDVVTEVLPAWLDYYEQGSGHGFWAAVERMTGGFLGWFHLRPGAGHPVDEPELGYRLRRTAWGQGYAVEGSRALIAKAFTELGAVRVLAETMVVHTASRRVMEKCGMRVSRTFHQDWPHPIAGDEHGDVEYAITLDEWRANAGERSRADSRVELR